eukprot:818189-Rhodomonas_salina.1
MPKYALFSRSLKEAARTMRFGGRRQQVQRRQIDPAAAQQIAQVLAVSGRPNVGVLAVAIMFSGGVKLRRWGLG